MHARSPVLRLWLVAARLARPRTDHSDAEHACLERWAAGRRLVVEIGVADGRGTTTLRRGMAPDGAIYAVDPFPNGRLGFSAPAAIARLEARRARGPAPQWLRMGGIEAAAVLGRRGLHPDLVFSDALFTTSDLAALWEGWRVLIPPGGIWIQSTSRPVEGRTAESHDTVRWTTDVLRRDPDFDEVDHAGTFTVMRRHDRST